MAVTYSFSPGNLIESAEVNQNFTDCAVIADAETITGAWTYTTTAADTLPILDAAAGDYDSGILFKLEGSEKWKIYCNDGDSDKLVIYDDANNASLMDFTLGGNVTINTNLAFDTTARTVAGIQNVNLLDKSASEDISGAWDFTTNDVTFSTDLTDKNILERFAVGTMDALIQFGSSRVDPNTTDFREVPPYMAYKGYDVVVDPLMDDLGAHTTTNLTWNKDYGTWYNEGDSNTTFTSSMFTIHRSLGAQTITHGIPYVKYNMWSLLDNFADGSVSGNWTTAGTVTEAGGKMSVNSSSTARYTAKNYYQTTDTVYFKVDITGGGGTVSTINISNGTNTVIVVQANTTDLNGHYKIKFNGTQNTCTVERRAGNTICDIYHVSIASVTTTWNVMFSGGSSSGIDAYWICDDDNASLTSTVSLDFSVDGAANYETGVTNGQYTTFSNTLCRLRLLQCIRFAACPYQDCGSAVIPE